MSVNAFKKGARLALALLTMVMMIPPGTLAYDPDCDDWTMDESLWKQFNYLTPFTEDNLCGYCNDRFVMGQKDFKYKRQGSTWSKNSYYAYCGDFEIAVID